MPLSPINQNNVIDVNNVDTNDLGYSATPLNDRGLPPTYEEAVDHNAPPPSYDSLFGRIREIHRTSTGVYSFIKNIIILFLGTMGCIIMLGVTIGMPISMIAIGALYLNECPQGEYIPIYLLVGGIFVLLNQVITVENGLCQRTEQRIDRVQRTPMQSLIVFFLFGWFILGSVWVYKEYEPNYDPSLGKYCNKTLYLFAFWLITSSYIAIGVVAVLRTVKFCMKVVIAVREG